MSGSVVTESSLSAVSDAVPAAHEQLMACDPALLSGADCASLVDLLARLEKTCAAVRARAGARAVACGAHEGSGPGAGREWLSRLIGVTAGQAQSEMDTALLAEGLPETRDALRRGELSLVAAREIVRTEHVVPGSEPELLALAAREPLRVLKDRARDRRLAAVEPEVLRARQREAREVRYWRDDLGMTRLTASLLPEDGAVLVQRIEAEADRLWRADKLIRQEPRQRLLADAFAKVVHTGGDGKAVNAQLIVVVGHRKFPDGDEADGPCHVIGGGPIPVSVARDIARDAFVKVLEHDGVDVQRVAHVGRRQPAELRTALLVGRPPGFRGPVCSVEGCGRELGLEIDHLDPVANGGPTALWNENHKCKPHHWEKTERDRRAGLLDGRGSRTVPAPDRRDRLDIERPDTDDDEPP